MSPLTQFNLIVADHLPSWVWDALQIVIGFSVLVGVFFQRRYSERFRKSSAHCSVDSIFIFVGQVGIAFIGGLAALILVDGLWDGFAPPRTFVVLFLFAYAFVQARTVYQATATAFKRFAALHLRAR